MQAEQRKMRSPEIPPPRCPRRDGKGGAPHRPHATTTAPACLVVRTRRRRGAAAPAAPKHNKTDSSSVASRFASLSDRRRAAARGRLFVHIHRWNGQPQRSRARARTPHATRQQNKRKMRGRVGCFCFGSPLFRSFCWWSQTDRSRSGVGPKNFRTRLEHLNT